MASEDSFWNPYLPTATTAKHPILVAEIYSMGDVVSFPPSSKSDGGGAARPISLTALRWELEAAARDALDTADRIIAALDRFEEGSRLYAAHDRADPIVKFRQSRSDMTTVSPEQA